MALLDVEADETYIGGRARGKGRGYVDNKAAVVSLVERGGRVRSTAIQKVTGVELDKLLKQHIAVTAHLNTERQRIRLSETQRPPIRAAPIAFPLVKSPVHRLPPITISP